MVKEASELGGELSELSDMSDMIDVHTPCDMNFVNMGGAGNLNDAGIGELSVKARHALRASDLNEEEMAARVLACKGRDVPLGEMEKVEVCSCRCLLLSSTPDAPKCKCTEGDERSHTSKRQDCTRCQGLRADLRVRVRDCESPSIL
eukprot:753421-Hanusia_phi.AAC.6